MKKIIESGKADHPKGSEVLDKKRYVDDIQEANSDENELLQRRNEVDKLLHSFGFEIKEWLSNNPNIGEIKDEVKVLGTRWIPKLDVLVATVCKNVNPTFTKRCVLSVNNGIWDPLGLLAGLLVRGKLIFQAIVRMKYGWDGLVGDEELMEQWKSWLCEVFTCSDIQVGRSLLPNNTLCRHSCTLVGFSDGSSVAHGCTLYLRWSDAEEENVEIKFIGAKGKVNPIKGTTTPRAEICGAFLLSRLAHSTENAFKDTELKEQVMDKILFTDSTTVLAWIKSGAVKYKPLVRNKIIEIQELHPIHCWQFVPRVKNNTADLVSKGCKKEGLHKIIYGPEFLKSPKTEWKFKPVKRNREEEDTEKIHQILSHTMDPIPEELPIDIERYSSWKKLLRVTAYVFKFGSKASDDMEVQEDRLSLNEKELHHARVYWLKIAQKKLVDDKIQNLVPFIDEDGIRRANGRLGKSKIFSFDQKHPVILPKCHKVSELIVQQIHNDLYHPGYSRVVAEVRKEFWVIGLRGISRRIGRNCIICRRWRGLTFQQMMNELPECRVSKGHPFEVCAVDYFGPFDIKVGYRRRQKAFGAIFTCLATRAAHVELVTNLSTQRFLLALRRFISIYGQPKTLRSDNGRNFVGAANELRTMLKQWRNEYKDRKELYDFCSANSFEWIFSTPLASHHNGCVEAMVKSVKSSLNKIVRTNVLSEEEYRTVLAQITDCINSRPLWPSSDDNLDQPITCNNLLRPTGLPRDPEFMNNACDPRTRYQLVQTIVDEWWKLWMTNFVPNLQPRGKWFKTRENVAEGDVVLLVDKDKIRSHWCMGIVVDVFPGKDGLVRSVRVKTSSGSYDRPITKLTLLLSKEERLDV